MLVDRVKQWRHERKLAIIKVPSGTETSGIRGWLNRQKGESAQYFATF